MSTSRREKTKKEASVWKIGGALSAPVCRVEECHRQHLYVVNDSKRKTSVTQTSNVRCQVPL